MALAIYYSHQCCEWPGEMMNEIMTPKRLESMDNYIHYFSRLERIVT